MVGARHALDDAREALAVAREGRVMKVVVEP
jgi:hypothetical protein